MTSGPSPSPASHPGFGNNNGGGGGGVGGGKLNVKTKQELNANEANLANLFANRDDGQDTFGNVGAMRCVFQIFDCLFILPQRGWLIPFF